MGTDSSSEQSKRRGFSLVESAIVLGVVGLVLGGIWWAASAMRERQKINDLVSGVILGADKLRNLVTPADYVTGRVILNSFLCRRQYLP